MSGRSWGGRRSQTLRAKALARYGWVCWLCGEPITEGWPDRHPLSASVDHVLPRSLGGSDSIQNLRPVHFGCNASRGNRPAKSARSAPARHGTEDRSAAVGL
jgi:5-methylcytosine-specific restriction endonuclease McrA